MAFQEDVEKMNLKSIVTGSIITALGFLVAFTWKDTMQEFINSFVPEGEGLAYKFIAAILITVMAVVIAFVMIKFSQRSIRRTLSQESVANALLKKQAAKNSMPKKPAKKRSRRLVRS